MNEGKVNREGLSSFINGLIGQKLLVEMRGDKYINGLFVFLFSTTIFNRARSESVLEILT